MNTPRHHATRASLGIGLLGMLAAGAGLVAVVELPWSAAAAFVVVAWAAALCLGVRTLARLVVISSFFSRFRVPHPVGLLLEHCAAIVALPSAMRSRSFGKALSATPVLLFALFIAWNALVSVLRSPDLGLSLRIVIWLSVDLVIVVVLLVGQSLGENPIRTGMKAAGWVAAAGLLIWVVARVGISTFGTQVDPLTGIHALYATAYEGNLFGSMMAMWLFVVVSGKRRVSERAGWVQPALMLTALMLSLTRAAILGLLAGVAVWQIMLPASAERRRALRRIAAIGALALLAAMTIPAMEPVRGRLSELTDFSSGTGKLRVENWKRAIDDLDVGSALTGLGTISFGMRHLDPAIATPTPGYVANLPLQVLYDSGAVGLVLLGSVFVTALPRPRQSRARALGLFVVFLISSLATSSLWFATTWIFLARGAFLRERERRERPGRRVRTDRTPTASVGHRD